MIIVERKIDKKPFNCNNCGAPNFETEWNDKVDYLTQISAGRDSNSFIAIRLCDKCMQELFAKLEELKDEG